MILVTSDRFWQENERLLTSHQQLTGVRVRLYLLRHNENIAHLLTQKIINTITYTQHRKQRRVSSTLSISRISFSAYFSLFGFRHSSNSFYTRPRIAVLHSQVQGCKDGRSRGNNSVGRIVRVERLDLVVIATSPDLRRLRVAIICKMKRTTLDRRHVRRESRNDTVDWREDSRHCFKADDCISNTRTDNAGANNPVDFT